MGKNVPAKFFKPTVLQFKFYELGVPVLHTLYHAVKVYLTLARARKPVVKNNFSRKKSIQMFTKQYKY